MLLTLFIYMTVRRGSEVRRLMVIMGNLQTIPPAPWWPRPTTHVTVSFTTSSCMIIEELIIKPSNIGYHTTKINNGNNIPNPNI